MLNETEKQNLVHNRDKTGSSRSPGNSDAVLEIVSRDLNAYLENGQDRNKRLAFLARKVEIHQKTLRRIANRENSPSYATIMKLYRFFYNLDHDLKVLESVPQPVRKFLEKNFPDQISESTQQADRAMRLLQENEAALEIYLLAAVKGFTSSELRPLYGDYGQKVVAELVREQVLSETLPGRFSIGPKKFTFLPELVVKAGKICTALFAKPEKCYQMGENYVGFYAEKLSKEAFLEWIKIDERAMQEKIKIAQRPESKGDLPAFCFNIVETFERG